MLRVGKEATVCTNLLLALLAVSAPADPPAPGTTQVVAIDRDWLAQRGNGPFILDQPKTTYRLKINLCIPGTAFIVAAPDIVLDLGGHEVVYGDTFPLVVRNAGFEEGSGRKVPGWDLKEAPAAEIAPNTRYLFGKQVLRLKEFRVTQRITSEPILVPPSWHTHAATITPAGGDYRIQLTMSVVDAVTGKLLGQGKSNNVERGFSAVAHFQPGPSKAVRLVVEAVPRPGQSETLDLDLATLGSSFDYGILASNLWAGEIPGWKNLEPVVGNLRRQVANFTVRNGTIRQGPGRPFGGCPLFGTGARGIAVEDVRVYTTGIDTTTIDARQVRGPVAVRRCTLHHDVENITNRMSLVSAIRLGAVQGPIDIEDNELVSVPQVGILLDGASTGAPVHIRRNRIQQRALVTNGYALTIVASQNFEVADNRITAENGRGIDIDSYRKTPVQKGSIHHNHVEVCERPNREYPGEMEARALRLRNVVDARGPHRDLHIHDNTFIATTGPGLGNAAYAVIISYQNADGSMSQANVRLERNRMRGITTRPEPKSRAAALDLEGLDAGVDVHFQDNILESNVAALALASSQAPVAGLKIVGNTFRRVEAEGNRTFHAILTGFWTYTVQDVAVIGPRVENHPALDIEWDGSGKKDLATGYLLDVTVRQGDKPVAGAQVAIEDREKKVVYEGKTDAKGRIKLVPLVAARYRQMTPDPRQITADNRGPFQVRVTAGTKTATKEIAPTGNQEIEIRLP